MCSGRHFLGQYLERESLTAVGNMLKYAKPDDLSDLGDVVGGGGQ